MSVVPVSMATRSSPSPAEMTTASLAENTTEASGLTCVKATSTRAHRSIWTVPTPVAPTTLSVTPSESQIST